MAQHANGYIIANQLFPATRTDWINVLAAIATLNSGATAPPSPFPFMIWVDTSTTPATIRQRNAGNTAWVVVGVADTTNWGLLPSFSPAMTGTPTAPTAANGTNTTQVATTAFVRTAQTIKPSWTNASFVNAWTNSGGTDTIIRYRKYPNDDVEVQGLAKKAAAIAAGETIFTLPSGSRPGDNVTIPVWGQATGGGPSVVSLTVNSSGAITVKSAYASGMDWLAIFFRFKGEL